jgi:hypothetical protein
MEGGPFICITSTKSSQIKIQAYKSSELSFATAPSNFDISASLPAAINFKTGAASAAQKTLIIHTLNLASCVTKPKHIEVMLLLLLLCRLSRDLAKGLD